MASSAAIGRFVRPVSKPQPQLASQSVQQFQTQTIPGLMAGTSATVGPVERMPTRVSTPQPEVTGTPVQMSAQNRMRSIAASNDRMAGYVAMKQHRDSQAKTTTPSSGAVRASGGSGPAPASVGSAKPIGAAYTPKGGLSAARNTVLQTASKYIGTQYVLGGTTTKGIDCSGLIMMVYNQFGYKLPHHSGIQSRTIPGVRTALSNLRPGDIIAWKDGSHIGIYAGDGYIIDAANRQIDTSRRRINMNRSDVYGIALRLPGE